MKVFVKPVPVMEEIVRSNNEPFRHAIVYRDQPDVYVALFIFTHHANEALITMNRNCNSYMIRDIYTEEKN